MNYYFLLIATIFSISACTAAPVAPTTSVTVPGMKAEWTAHIVAMLKEGQLAKLDKAKSDMARFCPKYASLDELGRIGAWAHLMGAVIKYESGYDPKNGMTESDGAYSQGLFQLTYGDSFCPKKKSEGDLNDPIVNLTCGVKIMASLVARDGVVAFGGYTAAKAPDAKGAADYWSVLRIPDPQAYVVTDKKTGKRRTVQSKHHLAEIIAMTKKAPGCI